MGNRDGQELPRSVCRFSVCTMPYVVPGTLNGKKSWHQVDVFGAKGMWVFDNVKVGDKIQVEGSIEYSRKEDGTNDDGSPRTLRFSQIVVNRNTDRVSLIQRTKKSVEGANMAQTPAFS